MNDPGFIQDAQHCAEALKRGGIALFPTDTIWGLGCDARNPEAVDKILRIKQRPAQKSFIVLMRDEEQLKESGVEPRDTLRQILAGSSRPTTVILQGVRGLAENVYASDGSVGIRIPGDAFCKELLSLTGFPLVSTSANPSGQAFGGSFADIPEEIKEQVQAIAHHRRTEIIQNAPSRVIRLRNDGSIEIVRD